MASALGDDAVARSGGPGGSAATVDLFSRASEVPPCKAISWSFSLVAVSRVTVTMAENVARATHPQLAELVQLLVERVQAKGRTVDPESIEWTPPARPLFQPAALPWRPRTDSNRQYQRNVLDWYLEVG